MNYIQLTSLLAPSIALLILSTTIRLGNVRTTIMDLAKISPTQESNLSENIFIRRATYLAFGLKHLTASFIIFMIVLMITVAVDNKIAYSEYFRSLFTVIFFILLLRALFYLYQETQLACHSIHTLTDAMRREKSNTTKNN